MKLRTLAAVAAVAITLTLAACSSASEGPAPTASPTAQAPQEVTLQVFAAASLTDAFEELADDFEAANAGVTLEFNFAGSSDLAAQINEGAPADVFASANETQMEAVGDNVPSPEIFASNTLTIVVAAGNPAGIAGLPDLVKGDLKLVVCAPEVPCGAATVKVQEEQGVTLNPVSEESNVTDVLGKVASGEADAGIVYVTDIARAEGVEGVALAGAEKAVNNYPIGAVAASTHAQQAQAFVDWVLSEQGQAVLASYGFASP